MWEGLGKHLRAGLVLSILLIFGAAVTSFALSFIALREVAASPITGWGHGAFLFPICIDIGLLGCEVAFLTLSMMKGNGLQQLGMAFFMVVFGALTVWFNTTRVPPAWRIVTAAPPITGIILTIVFATLLKAFAKHSGVAWQQQGAPPAYGMLGAPGSPIQGAIYRRDYEVYPAPTDTFQNGQNGRELSGNGVSKKRLVEQYLSEEVEPSDLRRITGREIAEELSNRGVPMTAQTANAVLTQYRRAHGVRSNGRMNGRKR
jgi:hypothetical protein